MDLIAVVGAAWRITWKNWPLWALALFMLFAFLPLGLLTIAFSTAANLASFDDPAAAGLIAALPEAEALERRIQTASPGEWLALAGAAVAGLVAATSLSLLVQAASMRGVLIAADGGRVALVQLLSLGRARAFNIFKLSLVFGLMSALLGLGPSAALVLVGRSSALGAALIRLVQTGLTPLTTLLNFGLLLLVMSVALEDFTPRAAFGRAGSVLKKGWWAFLLVIGISGAAVFATLLIAMVPPVFVIPLVAFDVRLGIYSTLASLACSGAAALFFFLFTVVFTQALYALVYREAARLTASGT